MCARRAQHGDLVPQHKQLRVLDAGQLAGLLAALAPAAIGAQVTVFDPDLDPYGRYAELLCDILVTSLGELGSARPAE